MISIPNETCAKCQRCCHGTPCDHIHAHHTSNHRQPQYDQYHRCEFLNSRNNCGILNRPIECAIYPIIIADGKIYVDMACPAWEDAVRQWDEQYGHHIDDYNDGREDHKFVDLWIAQSQIKELIK